MKWTVILACLNGPKLFRKYRAHATASDVGSASSAYEANFLENNCGFVLNTIETCWTITLYLSPFLAISSATRRSIVGMSPEFALKLVLGITFVYGSAYLGRGIGRFFSKEYLSFLDILTSIGAKENLDANAIRKLRQYDFDFRYWPTNYEWRETDRFGEKIRSRRFLPDYQHGQSGIRSKIFDGLCYVVAHVFARRLAYPGTLSLLQTAVGPALLQGRAKLVENMDGQRNKLRTKTGNEIDTMFVDRRNSSSFRNGNVLVITCEGNGGFYEVGSAATPLEGDYSVLMWNHPGFGGSTGVPWPSEEAAAIDVVLQFAMNSLGWEETDIVFFGWSIGGYTATWAAMNYPRVRGMILDATFDDVVPLAVKTMPLSWAPLVERLMRTYLNLDIGSQLREYDGPILIVRRSRDEVIAGDAGGELKAMRESNRGNILLKNLLRQRYPNILDGPGREKIEEVLNIWLAATDEERRAIASRLGVDNAVCAGRLRKYVDERGPDEGLFPVFIGTDYEYDERLRMAVFLAGKYLAEFDSTHCTPLPASFFRVPTHPWESS